MVINMQARALIDRLGEAAVVEAIQRAERLTSGEIRVVIAHRAVPDILEEARRQFDRMGMDRTAERNGVLIYLAPLTRELAIIGDQGIHERCPTGFWEARVTQATGEFRAGRFSEGLVGVIQAVGEELSRHFPRSASDRNELPDDVVSDRDTGSPG